MKKIALSIATTLMASVVLVACNGSTGSDVSSSGSTSLAKAVCTSSNNWQSVGVGMSADQVQARLGQPTRITTSADSSVYFYENCRAYADQTVEAVAETRTTTGSAATGFVTVITPYVPPVFTIVLKGGSVTLTGSRGVTSVSSPEPELKFTCELDYYNYPNISVLSYTSIGNPIFNCRTSNFPF